VWYVKAADQGEPRAQTRLKAIRNAAAGADPMTAAKSRKKKDRSPSNTRGTFSLSLLIHLIFTNVFCCRRKNQIQIPRHFLREQKTQKLIIHLSTAVRFLFVVVN
jgi:hypothetical protein